MSGEESRHRDSIQLNDIDLPRGHCRRNQLWPPPAKEVGNILPSRLQAPHKMDFKDKTIA